MVRRDGKRVKSGDDGEDLYLINEVSRLVDLSQKRIREYEQEGYLKPLREKNTRNRLYSAFDIVQIKQIRSLIHERGFTLACLRNFLVLAPCWNIFACPDKDRCPAYQFPHQPCYEVRKERGTLGKGSCPRCAIYLNRHFRKEKVLGRELEQTERLTST